MVSLSAKVCPSLLLACASIASAHAQPSPSIVWRVEAGFAPFAYTRNPDEAMKLWSAASKSSYASWASTLSASPGLESPLAEFAESAKGPWVASNAQYDSKYVHPTHTTIRARLTNASGPCEWTILGSPTSHSGQCREDVQVPNVPLKGATLSVRRLDSGEAFRQPIDIDHRVILAIGDSYGSGEGNPDAATEWKDASVKPGDIRWLRTSVLKDAGWWDTACHRSFWSSQTLAAVKIASSNPHRLVTYLHYSCSGAEVLDGMLVRQAEPPGIKKPCSGMSCYAKSSQLAAAVRDLCVGELAIIGEADPLARRIRHVVNDKGHALWRANSYVNGGGLDLLRCRGELTIPDAVLLSVGGNDAGFSQLAAWAISPDRWRLAMVGRLAKGKMVCPAGATKKNDGCTRPLDKDLAEQLERRYTLLSDALREVLPVTPRSVIQSTYPDPMLQSGGVACGGPLGYDSESPWLGAALLAPRAAFGEIKWHYNITDGEARVLSGSTLVNMRDAMRQGIQSNAYVHVDMHRAFLDHGWCEPAAADPPLALPSFASDSAYWRCHSDKGPSPSCWAAYAPSKRFIRTMNDSLLTQSSNRGDGHTGAVHPNLGGHATMADLIFDGALQSLPWIDDVEDIHADDPVAHGVAQ